MVERDSCVDIASVTCALTTQNMADIDRERRNEGEEQREGTEDGGGERGEEEGMVVRGRRREEEEMGLPGRVRKDEEGEGRGGKEEEEEEITVLFSMRCAKFLKLQVGSCVRVHPPW